jgi:hypothetical protein
MTAPERSTNRVCKVKGTGTNGIDIHDPSAIRPVNAAVSASRSGRSGALYIVKLIFFSG